MARMAFNGICTRVFNSQKNSDQYLTFTDLDTGGQIKLTMPSMAADVKEDDKVSADIVVITTPCKEGGGSYIRYRSGLIKKGTVIPVS